MRQKLDAVFPVNSMITLSLRQSRKISLTRASFGDMSPRTMQKVYKVVSRADLESLCSRCDIAWLIAWKKGISSGSDCCHIC